MNILDVDDMAIQNSSTNCRIPRRRRWKSLSAYLDLLSREIMSRVNGYKLTIETVR